MHRVRELSAVGSGTDCFAIARPMLMQLSAITPMWAP
jgi:hypothetical protein